MDDSNNHTAKVDASTPSSLFQDVEKIGNCSLLSNASVNSFSWENVTVTVKDRQNGQTKEILTNSSGVVKAGKMPTM